jgi:hypothetical protein
MLEKTEHPYYCSDSNYYSNEAETIYDSVSEFLNEMEYSDPDLNLCFRFDIREYDRSTKLYVEIFIMHQRKGRFWYVCCKSYNPETESERLEKYLQKHWNLLNKLWTPINIAKENLE